MRNSCLRIVKKKRLIWGTILLYIVVYGIMLVPHYSVDSYSVWNDLDELVWAPLSSGRLFFALWAMFFHWINFNPVDHQWIGVIALILALAFAHITVYKSYSNIFNSKITVWKKGAVWCSIGVVFCNPFLAEWFYYVETAIVYATAVVFCALAVKRLTFNTTKSWLLAFVYAVIAVNSYQAIISNFLILGAVYFLIENRFKLSVRSFFSIAGTVVVSAAASITALICTKVIPIMAGITPRFSQISVWDNIRYIISCQGILWKSGLRLMLEYWLVVALLICLVVIIVRLCAEKEWLGLLWTAIVLSGCYLSSFLVHYVNSSQWMVPRSTVSFFCFVACLMICAVWLWPDQNHNSVVVAGLTLVFLLGCSLQVFRVTLQQIETNHFDRDEMVQIDQAIQKYEKENNIQVTKCTLNWDQSITYVYSQITLAYGEINQRAFSVQWVALNAMEFYTGRRLEEIQAPEEIATEFQKQNWTELNIEEQLIFDGDTVHIGVY